MHATEIGSISIRSSPLILKHYLQPAEHVWSVSPNGKKEMNNDYKSALGNKFTAVPEHKYNQDQWIQNEIEFANLVGQGESRVNVIIDSIRDRGLDSFPENEFVGKKGFKLIFADTSLCYEFLRSFPGNSLIDRYAKDHGYATVSAILNDSALKNFNEDIQEDYLDPIFDIFKAELGLEDSDVILFPSIFERTPNCQRSQRSDHFAKSNDNDQVFTGTSARAHRGITKNWGWSCPCQTGHIFMESWPDEIVGERAC